MGLQRVGHDWSNLAAAAAAAYITYQTADKVMCKGLGRVPSEGYCEDKWLMSALPAAQLITVIENILRENTAYSY